MQKEQKTYYLLYTFFLVFFIAISYIAYYNYSEQKRIYAEQFNENQQILTVQVANGIQYYVDAAKKSVEAFSTLPALKGDSSRDKLREMLAFYWLKKNDFSTVKLYGKSGNLEYALPSSYFKQMIYEAKKDDGFFNFVLEGKKLFISDMHEDYLGNRVITVAVPIISAASRTGGKETGSEFLGAAMVTLKLRRIEELFTDNIILSDGGHVWAIDNTGKIILHSSTPRLIGLDIEEEFNAKGYADLYGLTLLMLANEMGKGTYEYKGVANYTAYAPISLDDHKFWSIAIVTPDNIVHRVNRENFKNNIIIATLLLILFFLSNISIYKLFRKFMQVKFEKEVAEKKRIAEKKYRVLFENSSNIIFIVSSDGYKMESFNKYFKKEFELSGRNFPGGSFLKMLDEANQRIFIKHFNNTLNGINETYELSIMNKDILGDNVFSITNTLIKGEGGQSVQCIGADITLKKQLSDELIETKNRLQAVFNGMHVGISLITKDFDIIMLNRFQAEWLKNDQDYFVGRKCYEAYRKRDTICDNCPAINMIEEKRPNNTEVTIQQKSGKTKHYNLFTYPVFDKNNNVTGFISSVQDITDMKSLETSIREKDRELQIMNSVSRSLNERLDLDTILKNVLVALVSVLKLSRGLVFLTDKEIKKKVLRANLGMTGGFSNRLTELWGSEEVINEFMRDKISITIDDIKEHDKISFDLKKLFESENIGLLTLVPIRLKEEIIGTVMLFDKARVNPELHDLRLLDAIGREIGSAVEKNRLFDKLKGAKKALDTANDIAREKDRLEAANELAGATTHELSQPLTTIISYAEFLMGDTDEDSNTYQTLKVISEEANRISGMVKKIAAVTKYDTKKYIGDTKIINIESIKDEDT